MEDLNETPKFNDLHSIVSMRDLRAEYKMEEEINKFLYNVKKCPLCGEQISENFPLHLDMKHERVSYSSLLKMLQKKIDEWKDKCLEIFIINYWLLIQAKKIPPKEAEIKQYVNIRNDAEKIFRNTFAEAAL